MFDKKNETDIFTDNSSKDLLKDPKYVEFLSKEPIESMGPIPENHVGPYVPTKEEWIQGANFILKRKIQNLQLRNKINEENYDDSHFVTGKK